MEASALAINGGRAYCEAHACRHWYRRNASPMSAFRCASRGRESSSPAWKSSGRNAHCFTNSVVRRWNRWQIGSCFDECAWPWRIKLHTATSRTQSDSGCSAPHYRKPGVAICPNWHQFAHSGIKAPRQCFQQPPPSQVVQLDDTSVGVSDMRASNHSCAYAASASCPQWLELSRDVASACLQPAALAACAFTCLMAAASALDSTHASGFRRLQAGPVSSLSMLLSHILFYKHAAGRQMYDTLTSRHRRRCSTPARSEDMS